VVTSVGSPAPEIADATQEGPHALVFYKVTCPTCQMAAPAIDGFERAYPGRIRGIGQDPAAKLSSFAREFGMGFRSVSDAAPYLASKAYGIEHVPTLVVVDAEGRVADVVESWDRDGYNRASSALASLLGVPPAAISVEGDGLPAFRPG
jgi:thiol-disulfide isomerase/thioredoxin